MPPRGNYYRFPFKPKITVVPDPKRAEAIKKRAKELGINLYRQLPRN